MFLNQLQEQEKMAFMELAHWVATIDGYVTYYEENFLEKYRNEMDLHNYTLQNLPIEEILAQFKTLRSMKIALAEVLGLVFSDGVYSDNERKSVQLIKKYFGFEDDQYESFSKWILRIRELSGDETLDFTSP